MSTNFEAIDLGTVAMVKNQYGVWNRCILTFRPSDNNDFGYAWRPGIADTYYTSDEFRRLVVIDPESMADIERLFAALKARVGMATLHEALVEYANPTPPVEEPLGIGSVIADQDDRLWARVATGDPGGPWWTREGDGPDDSMSYPHHWGDLSAREIRSEGYTPEAKS